MAKLSKDKKYGNVYAEPIVTPMGRFSWQHLVTMKEAPPMQPGQQPGTPKYVSELLLDKANPEVQAFLQRLNDLKVEMLTLFNQGKDTQIGDYAVLKDGDDDQKYNKEKYPYYKGMWVLIAQNKKLPDIVNTAKPRPLPIPANEIIGGMEGLFVITPILTKTGRSYRLEVVQKIKDDGTRFSGGVRDAVGMLAEALTVEEEAPVEEKPIVPALNGSTAVSPEELAKVAANIKASKGKQAAIDLL